MREQKKQTEKVRSKFQNGSPEKQTHGSSHFSGSLLASVQPLDLGSSDSCQSLNIYFPFFIVVVSKRLLFFCMHAPLSRNNFGW